MAILPAVYVTIEDQSFALPSIESGRVGFIVILSDRGEHNKVVQVNSIPQLRTMYGSPDINRTGQAHYLAEKFLEYSSRLFLIRPVLLDDPINSNNAAISNFTIKYNSIGGSTQLFKLEGDVNSFESGFKFIFTPGSDTIVVNTAAFEVFDVGDKIYLENDSSDNARQIVSKNINSTTNDCEFVLDANYDGSIPLRKIVSNTNPAFRLTTEAATNNAFTLNPELYTLIRVGDKIGRINPVTGATVGAQTVASKHIDTTSTPPVYRFTTSAAFPQTDGSYVINSEAVITSEYWYRSIAWQDGANKFYPGPTIENPTYKYVFITNSNMVEAKSLAAYNAVSVRDWIYPSNTANSDPSFMRQVVSKDVITLTTSPLTVQYVLVLDEPFAGISSVSAGQSIYNYRTFEVVSESNIRYDSQISSTDSDNIWTFYAKGAGKFYDNLFVSGVRNIQYESLYIDEITQSPLYPYAFMDFYLYNKDPSTGVTSLIEGPWTISMIKTIKNGQIVRDISTGEELYIESVINKNSEYIRCRSSLGSDNLLFHEDALLYRLQVLSLFSEQKVFKVNTLGENGIKFEKGEDGCQYDAANRLNLYEPKIQALLSRAYTGSLLSDDQSIENLTNILFPTYKFDYIICGGYSAPIQDSARALADKRTDALVLADTGFNVRADDDLAARAAEYSWNTFNAMLYCGYRQVFDKNTGRQIWITPVYHAIERHLYCDRVYWISEPVAGVEKGAISEPIKLKYNASESKLEDLISVELNPTIVEPDGVYLLTQFTTWKRLSILKRAHAVKFIHYLRKQIPPLLKDILQRKMTPFWINLASQRINGFMAPFVVGSSPSERYASISSFSVDVLVDEARSELRVILTVKPIRVIESIHVTILVK